MGEPRAVTPARIVRVLDADALAHAAAREVARAAGDAMRARGRFTVALSGGSTPRRLYSLLADPAAPYRGAIRWDAVDVFFGDERHVPPDHADSNYRMARETLLDRVRPGSVHRIAGELPDADVAAARYEEELAAPFGVRAGDAPPPALDLVLLGIGVEGHTASLFPGSAALDEARRWVVATFVDALRAWRITMTLPLLGCAREVLFLAAGADKAGAVAQALRPPSTGVTVPAARVRPREGALVWMIDDAAAARLDAA